MGPNTGAVKLAEQCDTLVVEELRRAVLEMRRAGGAARLIWCFGPDKDPVACNSSSGSGALRGRSVGRYLSAGERSPFHHGIVEVVVE